MRYVVPILAVVFIASVSANPENPVDPETSKRISEAYDRGGLRAAAAVAGSYGFAANPHCGFNAETVEQLVRHSGVIVVGRVVRKRAWLNAKCNDIATDYEVVVELSLKGTFRPSDRLTMSIRGGRIRFKDGSDAYIDSLGMALPSDGERYVLFLGPTRFGPTAAQRAAARGPIYTPSFQSRSLFLVTDDGLVRPKAQKEHPLGRMYEGKSENTLVVDVLDIVLKSRK